MYETKDRSSLYIIITAAVASLIGWGFFTYYRPMIIEAACSDIAESSITLYAKERTDLDARFNYENVKARCLEEIKYR